MKDVEPIRQVSFESIRHMDEGGNEFWYARELCKALGYAKWDSFEKVVNRAILSLTNNSTGINVDAHFNRIKRPVRIGYEAGNTTREIDDFVLSRYACYIIAQNGNPTSKPRVAEAQNYFATQTSAGKTFANELTASSIERGVMSFNDIKNDNDANNSEVRKTIIAQSGQAPEDFEPAEDTEKIRRRLKSHYGITDVSRKNLRSGEDGSNV